MKIDRSKYHNALDSLLKNHVDFSLVVDILTSKTGVSSSGFPYISNEGFKHFRNHIPHLYRDGLEVLHFINAVEEKLSKIGPPPDELDSINRAIKVIKTIVYTAGVTATPDLWLLRQVLGTHCELGTLAYFLEGHEIEISTYAEKNKLNAIQLSTDLHFLYSRGFLIESAKGFAIKDTPLVLEVFRQIKKIPDGFKVNMVHKMSDWFYGEQAEKKLIQSFMEMDFNSQPSKDWMAGIDQLELGYRLLPLVLGIRVAGLSSVLRKDVVIEDQIPMLLPEMSYIFDEAGMVKKGKVTELGARVFERGPGPFGIIAAYHPYMSQLKGLLLKDSSKVWVRRGANVAASQDANAKTFQLSNDSLNRFRKDYDFEFEVFIEHAI